MTFIAKRVQDLVPIWDLTFDNIYIGSMTDFPGEGPMATITFNGIEVTVNGSSSRLCLSNAEIAYRQLVHSHTEMKL